MKELPLWVGTAPQYGLLVVVVLALIAAWPKLRQLSLTDKQHARTGYVQRIVELEQQIAQQRKDCDATEEALRYEIKALHEELFGLRKQHIQEQISFIEAIIQTVDAPQLKPLLNALESGRRALEVTRQVKSVQGPIGDKDHDHA